MKNHPLSPSLRLIFKYQGEELELTTWERVRMVSPPSDPFPATRNETGFWYELRDAFDHPIYRRIIQNPIQTAAEVRSDHPEHHLVWREIREPGGIFTLLIPALDQACTLILFSSPPGLRGKAQAAREIARFDLTSITQGGE